MSNYQVTDNDVLAWVDLETGGLTPDPGGPGLLLEVALILTDARGNILREPTHLVPFYSEEEVADLKSEVDPVVLEMHEKTGLWERLSDPRNMPLDVIDDILTREVQEVAPEPRSARLAGSSVAFDARFSQVFLPKLYAHLHYRIVDVTTLLFATGAFGVDISDQEESEHSALADIERSLRSYRRFGELIKGR